jgi:GT2 family glycosyltransferase
LQKSADHDFARHARPASPGRALDDIDATEGIIILLRTASNVGFVASANRALACNRTQEALLLNSDALVFGDWLKRPCAAA